MNKNMSNQESNIQEFQKWMKEHNEWMENSINLIASENITSVAVKEAMTSDLSHRYAEGLSGQRFYEGCTYVDYIEDLTIDLSQKLYNAEHVNVQPTSGVVANLATFFAFCKPGDLIGALEVPTGGHISHAGVSAAGIRGLKVYKHPFDEKEMNIDTDLMVKEIREKQPKLIVLGGSLFLFPHPVKEAREAADEVGAKIMYDGAHVLGLIAGGQFQDPLKEGADVLCGSTHKTFPGPQGGIILTKKEHSEIIDEAVFPGVVSNHHLHHLAGLGIATAEMLEFGEAYSKQIIKNSQALGQAMYEIGFDVLCEEKGFTQSHQIAIDMDNVGRASKLAKQLESNNIILNKNLFPWDDVDNSDDPSGIRIGTQEVTRLGMKESEMKDIAEFIKRVTMLGENVKEDVKEFTKDYLKVEYAFNDKNPYTTITL